MIPTSCKNNHFKINADLSLYAQHILLSILYHIQSCSSATNGTKTGAFR